MGISVFPVPSAGGGVTMKVAEFTSSGTWTAPSNCTAAEVFVVGGGGGGGAVVSSAIIAGGGGGGGAVVKRTVPITGGAAYTVTVGTGGTRGTANGTSSITNAVAGGTSSFGSLITAYGGSGGVSRDNVFAGNYAFNTPTFGPGAGMAADGATTTVGHCTGGGGGGAAIGVLRSNFTPASGIIDPGTIITTTYNTHPTPSAINKSIQGSPGRHGQANNNGTGAGTYVVSTVGGYGIEGYGGGGGGGAGMAFSTSSTATNAPFICLGVDGGGNGGYRNNTTGVGVTAGSDATANTGGGGGGAIAFCTDSATRGVNGGNGADGYVKIVYWS